MQHWPLATGEVATLLGVSEPRLNSLVRLRKVTPPMFSGRRMWTPECVLQAARQVGLDAPTVRNLCAAALKGGAA